MGYGSFQITREHVGFLIVWLDSQRAGKVLLRVNRQISGAQQFTQIIVGFRVTPVQAQCALEVVFALVDLIEINRALTRL